MIRAAGPGTSVAALAFDLHDLYRREPCSQRDAHLPRALSPAAKGRRLHHANFVPGVAVAPVALMQGWAGLAAAICIALVGVALFVVAMLPYWTTEIGVTNHRFIFK
jgi:hypothetical protein